MSEISATPGLEGCERIACKLMRYRPHKEGRTNCLLIHGPPGVAKSTWAAAILRKLQV